MVVNKRKKHSRARGHTTYGYGSMKKNRGKGHKGGAGKAGSGKRADSKKPNNWKNKRYFGKQGFTSKSTSPKIKPVNVATIEKQLQKLLSKKLISENSGAYSVELEKLGYNKLLGEGKVTKKLNIKAQFASQSAIDKVKKAGGEVTVLTSTKEKTDAKKE